MFGGAEALAERSLEAPLETMDGDADGVRRQVEFGADLRVAQVGKAEKPEKSGIPLGEAGNRRPQRVSPLLIAQHFVRRRGRRRQLLPGGFTSIETTTA